MAKKTPYGRYILSAGEIGAYVVCPEAWRLKTVDGVRGETAKTVEQGRALHKEWAKNFEESVWFARRARVIFTLFVVAVVIYIFLRN